MQGRKHSEDSLALMRAAKVESPKGPASHSWKGGKHMNRGYVIVALSALPPEEQILFASMATRSSQRCIPEHRLVMARHLGRPLSSEESVHHRNGIKSDNRLTNLETLDNATHKREHTEILRELRAARAEIDRLKHVQARSRKRGTSIS